MGRKNHHCPGGLSDFGRAGCRYLQGSFRAQPCQSHGTQSVGVHWGRGKRSLHAGGRRFVLCTHRRPSQFARAVPKLRPMRGRICGQRHRPTSPAVGKRRRIRSAQFPLDRMKSPLMQFRFCVRGDFFYCPIVVITHWKQGRRLPALLSLHVSVSAFESAAR